MASGIAGDFTGRQPVTGLTTDDDDHVHMDVRHQREYQLKFLSGPRPGRQYRRRCEQDRESRRRCRRVSRKSAVIFGQKIIQEPSTFHIDRKMALVARTAAFVYI
jgi:hypothetical protein